MKPSKNTLPKPDWIDVDSWWGRFEAGDVLAIKGHGKARFVFVNHTVNHRSGEEWITVYGGKGYRPDAKNKDGAYAQYRCFTLEDAERRFVKKRRPKS